MICVPGALSSAMALGKGSPSCIVFPMKLQEMNMDITKSVEMDIYDKLLLHNLLLVCDQWLAKGTKCEGGIVQCNMCTDAGPPVLSPIRAD